MSRHLQKHVSFDRHGDKIEVIIRDSSFKKTYQKEVSISDRRELETLLKDLKAKGVDLIGLVIKKTKDGSGWFE